MSVRLIWSRRAVELWEAGKPDPMHTIGAPNVGEVYDGFVRQLRRGTPWILVDGATVLDRGTAGVDRDLVL